MINDMKDPRVTFGEAVVEAAMENQNVIVLSADSSSGSGLGDFLKKFPERHFEFGIMEQAERDLDIIEEQLKAKMEGAGL